MNEANIYNACITMIHRLADQELFPVLSQEWEDSEELYLKLIYDIADLEQSCCSKHRSKLLSLKGIFSKLNHNRSFLLQVQEVIDLLLPYSGPRVETLDAVLTYLREEERKTQEGFTMIVTYFIC